VMKANFIGQRLPSRLPRWPQQWASLRTRTSKVAATT
jgi:hypothetical protein